MMHTEIILSEWDAFFPDGVHKYIGRVAFLISYITIITGISTRGNNLYVGTVSSLIGLVTAVYLVIILGVVAMTMKSRGSAAQQQKAGIELK